jgi:hypothetical protein
MDRPTDNHDVQGDDALAQAQLRRERLRLANFTFTRTPNGRCAAEVELEWLDGARVSGKSSGLSSPLCDLRVAAEATIDALQNFASGALRFELVGVKTLRAFDANVVIVSVSLKRDGGAIRLLGSHLSEDDQLRSSAIAVLNATNRILGNFIAAR